MPFSRGVSISPNWRRWFLVPVAIFVWSLSFQSIGIWQATENWFAEHRMLWSSRPVGGDIVFVAIDKATLDHIGVWPWPRNVLAKTIDQLVGAEALEIFLDVDLSSPSTPEEDTILAQSLGNAGGTVILAAFSQSSSVNAGNSDLAGNLPIPQFRNDAWLATVNVIPDEDGVVRSFPFGHIIADEVLLSVPAFLSGRTGHPDTFFDINFAFDPSTVPSYSLVDVLSGKIPSSAFAQKTVVVGAHAIELRDSLAVPVHGTLSGAMLQILATETLRQDAEPIRIVPVWPLLLSAVLQILVLMTLNSHRLRVRVSAIAGISLLVEAIGFALFAEYSFVLPTVSIHASNLALIMVSLIMEMNVGRYLTLIANARAANATNILRQVFDDSAEAIVIISEDGQTLETSPISREMFAAPAEQPNQSLVPEEILLRAQESISSLKSGLPVLVDRGELQIGTDTKKKIIEYSITPSFLEEADRSSGANRDGIYVACIMARDITVERSQAERLAFLSRRDELTGAYRRHAFASIVDDKIAQLASNESCQLMVFNLNRFKTINSTLGWDVGNQLLCAVVSRLETSPLGVQHVARLQADTFAILLNATDDSEHLMERSDAVNNLLAETYTLEGVSVSVDARISYVHSGDNLQSAETMLNCAELVLDTCRNSGKRSIQGFDETSSAKYQRAREIERELRPALEQDLLEVHYQPQIDVSERDLVGFEALARWNHPVLGPISPAEFIEIAEASGMIVQLGRWILNTACREAATWPVPVKIGINVSPIQLVKGDIIRDLQCALETSGLSPSRLLLEITESSFLEGEEEIMSVLREIRSLGISLALDDFGTGYASLGYISRFPIDVIKVDQSFIRTLTTDLSSRSIVQFTKTLSDALNLTMLCEGVETEEQMEFLHQVGCDQVQGYLFGRPQNSVAARETIDRFCDGKNNLQLVTKSVA